jgi:hypothetical protein
MMPFRPMAITEPTTMATDYALAAACGWFAARLWARGRGSPSARLWSAAFVTVALGAAVGGTHHGFAVQLGEAGEQLTWLITVYVLGLTSFFLAVATAFAVLPRSLRGLVLGLAFLKLAAYAIFISQHQEFRYVLYDYGSAMAMVLLLQIVARLRGGVPGTSWLIGGVLLAFVGAAVQQSGLALHRHFNHNDLYHVIQMGALWLLYRGALLQSPHPNP